MAAATPRDPEGARVARPFPAEYSQTRAFDLRPDGFTTIVRQHQKKRKSVRLLQAWLRAPRSTFTVFSSRNEHFIRPLSTIRQLKGTYTAALPPCPSPSFLRQTFTTWDIAGFNNRRNDRCPLVDQTRADQQGLRGWSRTKSMLVCHPGIHGSRSDLVAIPNNVREGLVIFKILYLVRLVFRPESGRFADVLIPS